ncbi:MAG: hypothetical protein KIT54_10135 [Phycisphaeraceae bacterium]|nr:hypothetical protein [Phycisphaeraceae bacterium]
MQGAMKLAGFLIIAMGLVLGVASVPTAYVPSLSLPDEALVGLTLNAPAGEVRSEELKIWQKGQPIATTDTVLTAELLATLRDAGVGRVKVKEFSLARWSGVWLFLLACAMLLGGATLVRLDMRRQLAKARDRADGGGQGSPQAALAAIADAVESLRRDLPHMTTDHDRNHAIIERLGEAQSTHVPAFADARALLVGRLGLSGYAELMDHFAGMERQINRAWSAAADGVYEEAADCLERAWAMLGPTKAALER